MKSNKTWGIKVNKTILLLCFYIFGLTKILNYLTTTKSVIFFLQFLCGIEVCSQQPGDPQI